MFNRTVSLPEGNSRMRYRSMIQTILEALGNDSRRQKTCLVQPPYCRAIRMEQGDQHPFFWLGREITGNHQQQGKVYWEDNFRTTKTMKSVM